MGDCSYSISGAKPPRFQDSQVGTRATSPPTEESGPARNCLVHFLPDKNPGILAASLECLSALRVDLI